MQLVGQRRLARAAGAGDAEHGHGRPAGRPPQLRQRVVGQHVGLEGGDHPGQRALVAGEHVVQSALPAGTEGNDL